MVNILRRFSQPLMFILTILTVITFAWWTPNWSANSGREEAVTVIHGRKVKMEQWQREGRIMKIHAALGGAYAQLMDPGSFFGKISATGVENSLLFEDEAAALGVSA